MSVVDNCLALVLAISVGACGRIGFENQFETDAEVDKIVGDGRTESLLCEGTISTCAGTTVGVSLDGSTTVGGNLASYTTPLIPTCGNGPVAEERIRIVSPPTATVISIEVVADIDIILSIIADDCEGSSLRCTTILADSNGSLQFATQPDEVFIVSAASNDSCGDIQLIIRGTAQGS